ncbi:hypothetical protein [Limosilactobacillus panis]|uniref:Uncharacterized protein n=1 Tax=Limosilactobacillus panis TaxID=47493 RepID=A0ABT7VP12_9LACO|nr:hypothetical protein [Limosilactobacillus panis]MDM8334467.1 hypothetical protein [Limosilactobacillus panis]
MAERRMISKSLLMDNSFLSLGNDSKALYIYLLIFADDDGFVKRSVMVDGVLHSDDSNYQELEAAGLIISFDDEIKVITHWNGLETIREKLYSPTVYLKYRQELYIKVDYSYTKDAKDKDVFSSADNWVKNGRPKNIKDFKPLIHQHLQEVQYQDSTSTVPVQDNDGTCTSPDKNRLDKNSIDKSRTAQSSSGQQSKENKYKYINSSSNGGMGENASLPAVSTSTMDNNATRENGVITGEDSGVTTSSNETEINYLFDYLNGLLDGEDIPTDNERLRKLFDTALDNYRPEVIRQALEQLMTFLNGYPTSQIPSTLANHLTEAIKQVTANENQE